MSGKCKTCGSQGELKTVQKGVNIDRQYYSCPVCPGRDGGGNLFMGWANAPPAKRQRTQTQDQDLERQDVEIQSKALQVEAKLLMDILLKLGALAQTTQDLGKILADVRQNFSMWFEKSNQFLQRLEKLDE